jgi:ABC-2 type transport system permease protein
MPTDNLKSKIQNFKLNRILAQSTKELAQFRRDRLTLALAFLLPLMTLIIFGFAIRLEAKNIPLVVQDLDNSSLSRAYTERLFATNQFNPTSWRGSDSPSHAIDQGIAKVAVVIPPEFSRHLKQGKPGEVQVLVDGTDANNARVIKNSIQATTNFFLNSTGLNASDSLNSNQFSSQGVNLTNGATVTARTRIWFNPGRKESLYIVPGVYAVILWIYPSLLTAVAMVREKEQGTILQVYASSLSATELLLGKGLAYLLVGLSEALFIMILGSFIFGVGFAGDPTPLLVGTPIFLAVSVLFGLLIGVRASNQNAAVQAVALLGFLTAFLLSGFIYPLSNIPFPLSLITNVIPARYYIEITRDAFVRGTGWVGVWFFLLMIALLGLLIFNVARRGMSRMQLPD